ncbi:MAG: HNH endonuclease [Deltaproteobacteria bacterium]|nr:HNH endonuclease [Deltaproteobacteria bacterium]
MLRAIGLVPAGGNYDQVQRRMRELGLDTSHFTGAGWNVGGKFRPRVRWPTAEVLVADRWVGSHTLKKRLFREGLKTSACELCGWAERRGHDGVIPVELDHVNGDRNDNRIENLRILCPNCHALQPTHRGLNKRSYRDRT